jgi:hypothetical protein
MTPEQLTRLRALAAKWREVGHRISENPDATQTEYLPYQRCATQLGAALDELAAEPQPACPVEAQRRDAPPPRDETQPPPGFFWTNPQHTSGPFAKVRRIWASMYLSSAWGLYDAEHPAPAHESEPADTRIARAFADMHAWIDSDYIVVSRDEVRRKLREAIAILTGAPQGEP